MIEATFLPPAASSNMQVVFLVQGCKSCAFTERKVIACSTGRIDQFSCSFGHSTVQRKERSAGNMVCSR
jgi:hypothetical protein